MKEKKIELGPIGNIHVVPVVFKVLCNPFKNIPAKMMNFICHQIRHVVRLKATKNISCRYIRRMN